MMAYKALCDLSPLLVQPHLLFSFSDCDPAGLSSWSSKTHQPCFCLRLLYFVCSAWSILPQDIHLVCLLPPSVLFSASSLLITHVYSCKPTLCGETFPISLSPSCEFLSNVLQIYLTYCLFPPSRL